jgi:hypothetical protein
MSAPIKAPSVGPAAEAVAATAWRRAETSEDPGRFVDEVHAIADRLARGRDVPEPSLVFDVDPVLIAADVEARAGIRLLRSRRHGPFCKCDACRVRASRG